MSRLKNYIDLVKRGIPNIDKISEGLLNEIKDEFGLLSKDEQEEIAKRRLICRSCPLFSLNAKDDDSEYKKLFKESFKFDPVRNEYCGSCGCPYKTRTASLSSDCGLEYYNEINPDNKQALKWNKYNETTK